MADVVAALLRNLLGFCQSRASTLVSSTLNGATELVTALEAGALTNDVQARLQQILAKIAAGDPAVQPLVDGIRAQSTAAKNAVGQLIGELGAAAFTLDGAARAAADLAGAASALDAAIALVAHSAGNMDDPVVANQRPDIEAAVNAIKEPWIAPLRALGGAGHDFDSLASQVLGLNGASGQLASVFGRDAAKKELSFAYSAGGERSPVAAFPGLTVDQASLTAFVDYGPSPSVGVRVSAILHAGLRVDDLLGQIIPDGASKGKSDPTTIQLDSANGLTLGTGASPRVTLPFDFSLAGVEVHDVSLAVASNNAGDAQLELTTTIAGKLGGVMDIVVDGGGVKVGLVASPGAGLPITLGARLPDAAGVSVDAGVIRGGGYLYHKDSEYGGVLDLRLGTFGITAIGFVGTNPFSLVLVIGVEFFPAIELSWGFTLDGVGGLLALERRIDDDALRGAITSHSADTILFPKDPVATAPTILATLHDVFPYQKGGFVVGPILELGWGSQAKLVVVKLGIAIGLPDPKLVLLGSMRVAVPSTELPPELCVTNLNAELFGEITTDYFLLIVGLVDSRVGNMTISGDVGVLVQWGSSPEVALSVGGFHPHYSPPPLLAGLRRVSFDLSPAIFVTLHAEGYLAVTSNTVQFGAQVRLIADIGVASGEAWLGLDALFRWAPTFHFEVDISAGLSLKVMGHSFAGIDFGGHLEGTTPWKLQGTATLDVWYLPTIHFDVGPFQWGSENPAKPDQISPLQLVFDALQPADAWKPQLPGTFDLVVRLVPDDATPLLVHPLGALEVKQIKVPLETNIDHVGKDSVTAHRVNFANPKVGDNPAAAASNVTDLFAPADFLTLTDDQRLSRPSFEQFPAGARFAATAAPTSGPGADTLFEWQTIFPQEPALGSQRYAQKFVGNEAAVLRAGQVSRASRARANPYVSKADPVELNPAGQVQIRRRDDLSAVPDEPSVMTTTAAAQAIGSLVDAGEDADNLQLVALGVAP